jgi:predicted metal-binding membrane protein
MSAFDPKRTCEGRRRLVSQSNYFGPKMELTKMMPIALKSARSPVMVSCTPVEYDPADDRERSMVGDDSHPTAAFIAAKLRAAGFECEMVSLVPTEAAVLWRDRIVIVFAVAFLTALALSYLLWLSADMSMGGMDMTGFRMIPSGMGLMIRADIPWRAMEFVFVFAMWIAMMVGMMMPSAAPMFLMYARIGRQTEAQSRPLAATIWFGAGYFLVWIAFALLATVVQWAFERTVLLDFTMASTSTVVGGLLFVAAGSYQWTRLKDVCLTQCQTPFAFLMRQGGFRGDALGSLMLGVRHGGYCVGCCWALMALLLVGGVMNVLWIVLLALLVLLEKIAPFGRQIALLAGMVLIVAGVWLLSTGMSYFSGSS